MTGFAYTVCRAGGGVALPVPRPFSTTFYVPLPGVLHSQKNLLPLQRPFTPWCGLSHRAAKCVFLMVPQQTLRRKAHCARQVRDVAIWNMEWAFPVDSVILL